MFNALLTDARNTAERTARRAIRSAMLGACAAVCGAVALGFLTAAAFLALMHDHGAIAAALTLGIGYLVLAALCLVTLSAGRAPAAPPPPAMKPRPPLGEAFLLGMEAGRGFGKGFRSRR